jgi:small conductance mechanosensitive channel
VNEAWFAELNKLLLTYAVPFAGKVIGAILLWILGRAFIAACRRVVRGGLQRREVDPTLTTYVDSVMGGLLTVVLLIAILGFFGVETTTFAGLLTAAGVAIGIAWSGLLSNFAAGVFMIILRPFQVGDSITAVGVTGVVREVGLFATAIDSGDNTRAFVGNAKIFADTILNYTTNPYRRVEIKAHVPKGIVLAAIRRRLQARLAAIPNVLPVPAPTVDILEIVADGVVLAVRPVCHSDHYWSVYFATNEVIYEEIGGGEGPANARKEGAGASLGAGEAPR